MPDRTNPFSDIFYWTSTASSSQAIEPSSYLAELQTHLHGDLSKESLLKRHKPLYKVAMHQARIAVSKYDLVEFKKSRAYAMELVEGTYQRLVTAQKAMDDFIKTQKRKASTGVEVQDSELGILDADLIGSRAYPVDYTNPIYAKAMVLLDDYAKSFQLPYSYELRALMRQKGIRLINHQRERLMRTVTAIFDQGITTGCQWREIFGQAVAHCDQQYLQIRAGREALFQSDLLEDRRVEFDVERNDSSA